MKLCPFQASFLSLERTSFLSLERIKMPNLISGGGGGALISGTQFCGEKIHKMNMTCAGALLCNKN
jgi:hypothetical protein